MAVTRPGTGIGTSGGGGMTPSYWDAVFAESLYPSLFLYGFGAKRKVPSNFGLTIKITRPKRQTGIVATQHANSYGKPFTISDVNALCAQFVSGTLAKFRGIYGNSDIALLTTLGDPTEFAIRDIARDLALQMDNQIRGKLSAVSNGYPLAAGGTLGSVKTGTQVKVSDLYKAAARLRNANNPRWPDGKFVGLFSPFVTYDLKATLSTGYAGAWVDVNNGNTGENADKIFRGEFGSIGGVKCYETTNIRRLINEGGMSGVASASGWQNLILAPEAYYVAEMEQMTGRVIVKGLGSAGALDADNSLATVAAKVFFTGIRGFQSTDPTAAGAEFRYVRLITGSSLT